MLPILHQPMLFEHDDTIMDYQIGRQDGTANWEQTRWPLNLKVANSNPSPYTNNKKCNQGGHRTPHFDVETIWRKRFAIVVVYNHFEKSSLTQPWWWLRVHAELTFEEDQMARNKRYDRSIARSVFFSQRNKKVFHRTLLTCCFGQRILTDFVRGNITEQVTSCLTGLDSTNQVNLLLIQCNQSSWFLTSEAGGQL